MDGFRNLRNKFLNKFYGSVGSDESSDSDKDNSLNEVFWTNNHNNNNNGEDFDKNANVNNYNNYSKEDKKNMINDLLNGFCSSEDYLRLITVSRKWRIKKRDAAELIVNFDTAQSFINNTWL